MDAFIPSTRTGGIAGAPGEAKPAAVLIWQGPKLSDLAIFSQAPCSRADAPRGGRFAPAAVGT